MPKQVTITINEDFMAEFLLLKEHSSSRKFDRSKPSFNRLVNCAMAYYVRHQFSRDSLEKTAREKNLSLVKDIRP